MSRSIARHTLPQPSIREFTFFFLLTYALSWWPAIQDFGLLPHGPAFAAVIVVALVAGRRGLAAFWGRLTQWRAGRWYLIGPAVILSCHVIAFAGLQALDVPIVHAPSLALSSALALLLLGGQWEEPGWTGYALPRLQQYFAARPGGQLLAALVLGSFRALWHAPLVLAGPVLWFDAVFLSMAMQLTIAWISTRTRAAVPVAVLLHYASNIMGATMGTVYTGEAHTAYYASFIGVACVVAVLVSLRQSTPLPQSLAGGPDPATPEPPNSGSG